MPMGGRSVNLTEYLTSPPQEMDMEDEDIEYEAMMEAAGDNGPSIFEGARVNTDLYDAYGTHSWSPHPQASSLPRRSMAPFSGTFTAPSGNPEGENPPGSPPPLVSQSSPPIPLTRTANRSSVWGGGSTSTVSSLARQPSIRRAVRSRTVDFNDFSTRRRSTHRNTAADSDDHRSSEEVTNSWGWGPPVAPDESIGYSGARRFFPFSRRRSDAVAPRPGWLDSWANVENSRASSPPEPISFRPWPAGSAGSPTLIRASSFREHETSHLEESDRSQFPRLRRGGLRAPESMLSRHASPIAGATDEAQPPIAITVHQEAHTDTAPVPEASEVVTSVVAPINEQETRPGAGD